jgi:hypothetical protein
VFFVDAAHFVFGTFLCCLWPLARSFVKAASGRQRWRFTKRQATYGRYHATFAEFRAAVEDVLNHVATTHAEKQALLRTLSFQEHNDVPFLAA